MKDFYRLFISFIFLFSVFSSCIWKDKKIIGDTQGLELKRILESGKLKVAVDFNSTNYFVYKGRPMGFTIEILQELAKDMNVELDLIVSNSLDESFRGLRKKRYDLIAKNLTVTKNPMESSAFTEPLMVTRQVLVQRKPDNFREMSAITLEKHLIRNPLELAGKKVHVQSRSSYYTRLANLSEEIGADIQIEQDSIYGLEQLVAMVAHREIEYTVCNENVANVNQTYFPILDVKTPVSFPQNIAWAVNAGSTSWLEYLNNWIINFKKTAKFRAIYQKYYENIRTQQMVRSEFHSANGKFSEYDDMIREECAGTGLDWRLVAAIIYHESNFDSEAQSWAGAYGLMQIMPETGERFLVDNIEDPKMNIRAGIRNLKWLEEKFTAIPDSTQRLKFILAAYNIGLGHVLDAQKLAKKYQKDPTKWDGNVDYFLMNKSAAKYYEDRVVKSGYCRGEETISYVISVITTYMHYKNAIPERAGSGG